MDLYFGWHELRKKTAQKSQADNEETTATPRKAVIFHLVFLFEHNIRQFRHENLTGWPGLLSEPLHESFSKFSLWKIYTIITIFCLKDLNFFVLYGGEGLR